MPHAHEANGLLLFLSKRNYDPQYKKSRNKDNSIAKQCQIKATSKTSKQTEK